MPATLQACVAQVAVPLDALLALVVDHVAQEVDELGFARCASLVAQVVVPLDALLALVVDHVTQEESPGLCMLRLPISLAPSS